MEKTVCELFAGVGGFRLGLEKSSDKWDTVWFSQWEPNKVKQWAHECYVSHWEDIDEYTGIDISLVKKSSIPNHNLLVGGFPCQDYSVARSLNGSSGIEGKKGVLWWQIQDILKEKKPPFVLLENVDRLLKSPANQRGRDFGIMLACFAELDYSVEWRVINAADYGEVQRRRRVFIFAYKNSTNYSKNMNQTPEAIILSAGLFAKGFPIENKTKILNCTIDFNNLLCISEKFEFSFENSGYMHNGMIYTGKTTPLFVTPLTLRTIIEPNVDSKYYIKENLEKWKYLKGSKKIKRISRTGHEYIFSEGAIAFPDPIDSPARTMLTSESSVNRSTHVIEDPETKELRIITPVEAERIQGFNDNWTNTGMPEKFRYFVMGNALVVPIVEKLGSLLLNILNDEH